MESVRSLLYTVGVGLVFLAMFPMHAQAAAIELHVDLDGEVIFCDVDVGQQERVRIRRALQEGTPITLTWNIRIEVVNRYWLNSTLASVKVVHKVIPDLVSGIWRLQDITSGIERRVADIDSALAFLTRLRRFPVIDRSLLAKGTPYRMVVTLEENEGEEESAWWMRWWGYRTKEAAWEFSLP